MATFERETRSPSKKVDQLELTQDDQKKPLIVTEQSNEFNR